MAVEPLRLSKQVLLYPGEVRRIVPDSEFAQDDQVVQRLLREFVALRELRHPVFPQLFDQGVTVQHSPFIVMEHLQGESLESHRLSHGGQLGVEFVLTYAERTLEALEFAHGQGWLHRDISPNNLFVTPDNEPHILDLGLCRAIELSGGFASITGPALLGTPGFIGPEQARGDYCQVDARADIWSLGATLFVLLSGHPVHPGTVDEQMRAVIARPPRSIQEVAQHLPPAVVAWLDRALAYSVQDRWTSAREMRRALLDIIGTQQHWGEVIAAQAPARNTSLACPSTVDQAIGASTTGPEEFELLIVHCANQMARHQATLDFETTLTLGRDPDMVTWAIADDLISRTHASVSWSNQTRRFRIVDQASRNGLYVNGTRTNMSELHAGDVIRLGASLFVVVNRSHRAAFARAFQAIVDGHRNLLLVGELGVGKEHLARQVHKRSGRPGGVTVFDCAAYDDASRVAVSPSLESTSILTSAFEAAHQGTLFLREVGNLPLRVQSELLHLLQKGAHVDAVAAANADVRVIASTSISLDRAVTAGKFRLDLYASVAGLKLRVPPLRERRHEILDIFADLTRAAGFSLRANADAAESLLVADWPSNVRGLRRIVAQLSVHDPLEGVLDSATLYHVEPELRIGLAARNYLPSHPSTKLSIARKTLRQRPLLEELLVAHAGSVSKVASELGVSRAQVYRWIEKLGINIRSARGTE